MEQRLSVVTLGVSDLRHAREFYEALGWRSRTPEDSDVVFFQAGGMVVSLWDHDKLAGDSGVERGHGYGSVTLAYNARSPDEVDSVIDDARDAGAEITREAGTTFWGGYSGVFTDPDGHPWEIAHNPHWTVTADGGVELAD